MYFISFFFFIVKVMHACGNISNHSVLFTQDNGVNHFYLCPLDSVSLISIFLRLYKI